MMGAALLLLSAGAFATPTGQVPLKDLARHEQYRNVKISPDGEYLAATAVVKDKTVLSLIHLADMKGVNLQPLDRDDVLDFWWVGSHRVVFTVTQRIFGLDGIYANGELYAVNGDGSGKSVLYSARRSLGGEGFAEVLGRIGNTGRLLIETTPSLARCDRGPYPTARSLGPDGHMEVIATAPICGATFVADNQGTVRFAYATDEDQFVKVYYRATQDAPWQLVLDEAKTKAREIPLRFNRDGTAAYFECGGANGVGGVCLWNTTTREMKTIWSGAESGHEKLLATFDGQDVFAIMSMPGRPAITLLDKNASESRLLAGIMQQFPGQQVELSDNSADGKKIIFHVRSDTNPGEFYLFDVDARKASFLLADRPWIKPEQMAMQEPVALKARDGNTLHGYLTKPLGREKDSRAPLVVYIHGGPYGIRDRWEFDPYVQALATRGYAVLQVNFRGSGGYGDAFLKAGIREWGGKMQDDVTDATQWAIAQGVADPQRICIFGASYGGYSALEGAVKEPDLYKCAIGYAGIYDLRRWMVHGDIPTSRFGKNYLKMALGEDEKDIAARSPIAHIDKLTTKVMLIVGGIDERVPEEQAKRLRDEMRDHHMEPEWLYDATEGHGFYREDHIAELFQKLIAFLDRNIGAGSAAGAAAAK